jgi:mannosyltransferase OCH1-like enzyme
MNMITYNNVDLNVKYKFACVISFYNRSEFVSKTFESINKSFLPENLLFIIIDDGSDENVTFNISHPNIFIKKSKNYGISHSLVIGWDIANILNVEYFLNLDSDVIVSVNWLSSLFNIHRLHSKLNVKTIATGFNGVNHSIKSKGSYYQIKHTLGGINLFYHRALYMGVRKSLTSLDVIPTTMDGVISNIDNYGTNPKIHSKYNGWDWGLVHICKAQNIELICTSPSVIQHIGKYGISSTENFSEIALDFKDECVPKIIHQMWVDENIPQHLKLMQNSVKELHPHYEYKFWTDRDLEEFLIQNYPNVFIMYERVFPYVIQKMDFIRLLLVYHFGGIYIDLDVVCTKNADNILKYPCTLINTTPHNSFSKKHYPIIINNAFISAERGNDFIRRVLMRIIEYRDPQSYEEYCSLGSEYTKVLKSTGPLCVTDAYIRYNDKSLINVENVEYFYGVEYERSLSNEQRIEFALNVSSELDNSHFIHMHHSSWYNSKSPYKNKKYKTMNMVEIKNLAKLELESIW